MKLYILTGIIINIIAVIVIIVPFGVKLDFMTGVIYLMNPFAVMLKLDSADSFLKMFTELARVVTFSMGWFIVSGFLHKVGSRFKSVKIISFVLVVAYFIISINIASLYWWNVSLIKLL